MKTLVPVLCVMLLLSACASSPGIVRIQESDPNEVISCQFITTVYASTGGCFFIGGGIEDAKNKGLEKAANLGATHIVWTNLESGFFGSSVNGRAYSCK